MFLNGLVLCASMPAHQRFGIENISIKLLLALKTLFSKCEFRKSVENVQKMHTKITGSKIGPNLLHERYISALSSLQSKDWMTRNMFTWTTHNIIRTGTTGTYTEVCKVCMKCALVFLRTILYEHQGSKLSEIKNKLNYGTRYKASSFTIYFLYWSRTI